MTRYSRILLRCGSIKRPDFKSWMIKHGAIDWAEPAGDHTARWPNWPNASRYEKEGPISYRTASTAQILAQSRETFKRLHALELGISFGGNNG